MSARLLTSHQLSSTTGSHYTITTTAAAAAAAGLAVVVELVYSQLIAGLQNVLRGYIKNRSIKK